MTFHLTQKAKSDLIDIARYTEDRWGRDQRNIYLKQIDDAFHDLAEMPSMGSECDPIRRGYRKFGVGKHLIFYRSTAPDHVEFVRVLHGRMNVEGRLSED